MAETPASPTIYTPATTTVNTPAPSVIEAPKVKLSLAIRKNIRDEWEAKKAGFEEQLSRLLDTSWTISVDPGHLWSYGEEGGFVKQNPGRAISLYIEDAIPHVEQFVDKYGEDGKRELNSLASAHAITIEETGRSDIFYSGCEVSGGLLRILFAKNYIGTNSGSAMEDLLGAVSNAGITANASSEVAPIDFSARMSIRNDYKSKVGELQQKFRQLLNLPTLSLIPNFESNFAKITFFIANSKKREVEDFPREWQKQFGWNIYEYFDYFFQGLDNKRFGDDDLMQEGFAEAVDKHEVGLRVVDKLQMGTYNECIIENGVLWMQTTPKYWTTNIRDPVDKVLDIL